MIICLLCISQVQCESFLFLSIGIAKQGYIIVRKMSASYTNNAPLHYHRTKLMYSKPHELYESDNNSSNLICVILLTP